MKKLLSILCIFIMLFSCVYAEGNSKTAQSLIWSNPVCEWISIAELENKNEILKNTIENAEFMAFLKENFESDYEYVLDEFLMVELLPYNDYIVWHFTKLYDKDAIIYNVLVDMDYQIWAIFLGDPLRDGSVLYDFSEMPGGTYYMLVFSNT